MGITPWQAGQRITAARLNLITPVWSSWTPTWTTNTGANTPSFGDAGIVASYAQVADVVFFRMELSFGSTTNFGGGGTSDNWQFSLPVTAAATAAIVGIGEGQDTSVGSSLGRAALRVRLTSTTVMELEVAAGRVDATAISNGGLVDAATPWTWANGDFIRVFGQYQAA